MDRETRELYALEGRMIAHRQVLARLIGGLPSEQREMLTDWLGKDSVMHDGQEDPGAVTAEGAALQMAISDEIRLLHNRIAARQGRGETGI